MSMTNYAVEPLPPRRWDSAQCLRRRPYCYHPRNIGDNRVESDNLSQPQGTGYWCHTNSVIQTKWRWEMDPLWQMYTKTSVDGPRWSTPHGQKVANSRRWSSLDLGRIPRQCSTSTFNGEHGGDLCLRFPTSNVGRRRSWTRTALMAGKWNKVRPKVRPKNRVFPRIHQ